MDFSEIKNAVGGIKLDELRVNGDNHFEAVIVKDELSKVVTLLEGFFGPPAFPSKVKLSASVRQDIDAHGGIMGGQTLYYSASGGATMFAMLWPWGDGQKITVKIFRK